VNGLLFNKLTPLQTMCHTHLKNLCGQVLIGTHLLSCWMDIDITNFNLDHTLGCGQVFRWKQNGKGDGVKDYTNGTNHNDGNGDSSWTGIISNDVVCITQTGTTLSIDTHLNMDDIIAYLRLNDNLDSIHASICKDEHLKKAVAMYDGLHLIQQDIWECLITYMCSTASNIPMIEKRLSLLSRVFGHGISATPIEDLYSFPEPIILASASEQELLDCKLGFRAMRIKKAAQAVVDGTIRLEELSKLEYHDAKSELMKLDGIGDKVADCILLFSCGKDGAFPVDTHISQIMRTLYFDGAKMSDKKVAAWARAYFGPYCGYAQQYLYHYKRMNFSR